MRQHPQELSIEPQQQVIDLQAIDQIEPHPKMRPVMRHWQALDQRHGGLPARDQLDACAFIPCLGDMMLLKVIRDGADYRYDLVGENIRDLYGATYNRRTLRQIAFPGYETLLAEYQRVVASGRPHYFERRQISERLFMEIVVGKLILPLRASPDHDPRIVTDLLVCLSTIG